MIQFDQQLNSSELELRSNLYFNTTFSNTAYSQEKVFLSLESMWTRYAEVIWDNGQHKTICKQFILEINDYMKTHDITTYDDNLIDNLIRYYRNKGNKNSTINRKFSALFKLLKKAQKDGKIVKLPSYVRLREKNARIRFLTREEEEALFTAIEKRDVQYSLLCKFLIDTGARVGEALALNWSDIHNGRVTFWITKSGRSRSVPLTQRAQDVIEKCKILSPNGPFKTIEYQNFKYAWNKAKEECRLHEDPDIVPHILRHTCASRLVQAGIDLRRVQTFLGHQTIQMTIRYAHLATNDLDQCVSALEKLRNSGNSSQG